ncbi:MAG: hypothetical protein AVW05_02010 [Hadesarchaea archaeon DG-33]|nr:MAG: hypothetical protein AVW05_02010 [Hadesarchaea archaeon DG-33]
MAKKEVVIDSELLDALKITLVKTEAVTSELGAEKVGKIIGALLGATEVGAKKSPENPPEKKDSFEKKSEEKPSDEKQTLIGFRSPKS